MPLHVSSFLPISNPEEYKVHLACWTVKTNRSMCSFEIGVSGTRVEIIGSGVFKIDYSWWTIQLSNRLPTLVISSRTGFQAPRRYLCSVSSNGLSFSRRQTLSEIAGNGSIDHRPAIER